MQFSMRSLRLALPIGLLAAGPALASTVTLEFTGSNQEDLGSYSEAGYTITDLFGAPSQLSDNEILANRLYDNKLVIDETMAITNDSGALFRLDSFAFAGEDPGFFTDRFEVRGLLNGVEVWNSGELTTNVGNLVYQTVAPAFSPFVDTLHIVGLGKEDIGVFWDDFVLTTVTPIPLPAGVVLLISCLGALVFLGRRV